VGFTWAMAMRGTTRGYNSGAAGNLLGIVNPFVTR
jgi:hypothetical protein